VVPGSDTAKVVAEQQTHTRPYLLFLGDRVMIGPWDIPDDSLLHVTLNTGHTASIPRSFVKQQTVDILRPLVRAGGGPVPNMPFTFFLVEHAEGAATISVRYGREGRGFGIIAGTICERQSNDWWKHLLHTARAAGVSRGLAPPSSTPWLGVVIVPSPVLAIMSPDEVATLAGLENSIAWTWLRRHEADDRHNP
jgi:hypothetical protein